MEGEGALPFFSLIKQSPSLHAVPSPANVAAHLVDAGALEGVVPRLGRRLVDDVGGRPAQPRPLAPEADVADARDVLGAVPEVVGQEEAQPLHLAEEGALDGYLLDLGGLGELERLHGLQVLGGGEVEVVAVDEEVAGPRGRVGRRGPEEDGVQLDLRREPMRYDGLVTAGKVPRLYIYIYINIYIIYVYVCTVYYIHMCVCARACEMEKNLRYRHEKLLVRITLQLRLDVQPLRPSLLHHGLARVPP